MLKNKVAKCLLLALVLFASCSSATGKELHLQEKEVEVIRKFVHPNVTEESPVDDDLLFNSAGDRDRGYLGIRVICQCGLRNNGTSKPERKAAGGKRKKDKSGLEPYTEDNKPFSTKVVQGVEANVNEYPWIVALVYNLGNGTKVHFCGGTLFSSRYILTATHCLEGKSPEKTEVWLNQHDILLKQGETLQIKAERFIRHPGYHLYMHYNDISIIQLVQEVDIIRESFRPICLPPSTNFEPLDSENTSLGIAAGWGQVYYAGPKSDRLMKVSVPILSNIACIENSEAFYRRRVTEHMICAGDIDTGGRDTCPGDSGGPLFVRNEAGKHILVGIVSWGYRCGEPRRPGVYTRVSKYIGWINMEAGRGGQRCAG